MNSQASSCSEVGVPQWPRPWLQLTMKGLFAAIRFCASNHTLVSAKLTITLSPVPPCMQNDAGPCVLSDSMREAMKLIPPEFGATAATYWTA